LLATREQKEQEADDDEDACNLNHGESLPSTVSERPVRTFQIDRA
jgi:hypothetical protein